MLRISDLDWSLDLDKAGLRVLNWASWINLAGLETDTTIKEPDHDLTARVQHLFDHHHHHCR